MKIMSRKNRDTIGCCIIAAIVTILVIVFGHISRGNDAPGAEIVIIPALIGWIWTRRKTWGRR
jgi:hypothetical protein